MRIELEIPKEFEKHFNEDKFKDSFERIIADINHSLENGDCSCAGRYECETIEMLENAFENSRKAYDVKKVVNMVIKTNKKARKIVNRDKTLHGFKSIEDITAFMLDWDTTMGGGLNECKTDK